MEGVEGSRVEERQGKVVVDRSETSRKGDAGRRRSSHSREEEEVEVELGG